VTGAGGFVLGGGPRGDDVCVRPLSEARLRFKRAFAAYYLDLCSYRVATPGEAYEACAEYLGARQESLGTERAERDLAEELARIAGEMEQDLRRRHRDLVVEWSGREPLEERLHECVRAVRRRGLCSGS
jgi:hypothetical protein